MPKGKKVSAFRSDSAAYQAEVMNYCEENGISFAIGGVLDAAVKEVIKSLAEEEWRPYRNGCIGATVHCMQETKKSFRLVVIRRPYQVTLFDEGESERGIRLLRRIEGNRRKMLCTGTISAGNAVKTGSKS